MKLRKVFASILAVSVIGAGMIACSKDEDKKDETEAPVTEATEDTEASQAPAGDIDLFFVLNGIEVRIGDNYADIKDQLGDEIKPEDRVIPCEGDCEYLSIIHTYDGFTVEENQEGIVCNIGINGYESGVGDALFMGQFKYGDSFADVMAAIPMDPSDSDETYAQYFITDTLACMINTNDDGEFGSASMYDFSLSFC